MHVLSTQTDGHLPDLPDATVTVAHDHQMGITKHRTSRTGPKYRSFLCKKGWNWRVAIWKQV